MQRFISGFYRCEFFIEILQCKLRFLTLVVLPLASSQIGQVDDILSKLPVWNVEKICLGVFLTEITAIQSILMLNNCM